MADITLRNIKKTYGKTDVIHGVNLDIKSGEFVVFVGPSGCGKSTLLRLIAGLDEITSGELMIDNTVVNHVNPADRGIAMVFQTYALYPHLTVRENIGFGMKMNGVDKEVIARKVSLAAKSLQLEELLDRKPKQLSGGQRQRVAIGRAIVRDPKVFLFDEPLSNLDAELRVDMRLGIAKLHRELDATMIYVTHDQVEAMTLADKIVVLRKGNVEQVGSPLELYNRPANEFVAGFIGSPKMNLFDAKVRKGGSGRLTVELDNGACFDVQTTTTLNTGDKVRVGIRPEHIALNSAGDVSMKLATHATERLGASTYLFGNAVGVENCRVHIGGDVDVQLFSEIDISFKVTDCHIFYEGQCISNL